MLCCSQWEEECILIRLKKWICSVCAQQPAPFSIINMNCLSASLKRCLQKCKACWNCVQKSIWVIDARNYSTELTLSKKLTVSSYNEADPRSGGSWNCCFGKWEKLMEDM